jgi:hypothetical protein
LVVTGSVMYPKLEQNGMPALGRAYCSSGPRRPLGLRIFPRFREITPAPPHVSMIDEGDKLSNIYAYGPALRFLNHSSQ